MNFILSLKALVLLCVVASSCNALVIPGKGVACAPRSMNRRDVAIPMLKRGDDYPGCCEDCCLTWGGVCVGNCCCNDCGVGSVNTPSNSETHVFQAPQEQVMTVGTGQGAQKVELGTTSSPVKQSTTESTRAVQEVKAPIQHKSIGKRDVESLMVKRGDDDRDAETKCLNCCGNCLACLFCERGSEYNINTPSKAETHALQPPVAQTMRLEAVDGTPKVNTKQASKAESSGIKNKI